MGKYNERIVVLEEKMKCCKDPESPLIEIALKVMEHYKCPWRASEDITVQISHMFIDAGWTIEPPKKESKGK